MAQTEQVLRRWAAVTVKKWRSEIVRLRIGKTGALASSFQTFIMAESGGDIEKIRFLYRYYGKFVDMGVGKGQKLGSADSRTVRRLLGTKARSPKKWYSKPIAKETYILAQILQNLAGNQAANVLDNLALTIVVEL